MTLVFSPTLVERYWAKVDRRGPDECWPWLAGTAERYPHGFLYVGRDGKRKVSWTAHRVGWLIEHGAPPGRRIVRHTCDWGPCQNPAHWVLGTRADNVADMYARGRARSVGRPGGNHHAAKVTVSQVAEIRQRVFSGESQKAMASEYGLSKQQVSRIVRGERWAS